METPSEYGTLYVVATPVGNLDDMTFRAIAILKQVDLIAAEDTRHSMKLMTHFGIATRLISCHEHNESDKTPMFVSHLKNGLNIALISDAGTPTISDPGYHLIRAAAKEKIRILPVPGCCAAMAGLCVSGLPTDAFYFSGFLPKKSQKIQQALEQIKSQKATLIFYESPRRIKSLIEAMIQVLGDREACLAREITKLHEEYVRGSLSHILAALNQKETIKGECMLFVQGCGDEKKNLDDKALDEIVREKLITSTLRTSELARQLSRDTGFPKNQIYEMILRLRS